MNIILIDSRGQVSRSFSLWFVLLVVLLFLLLAGAVFWWLAVATQSQPRVITPQENHAFLYDEIKLQRQIITDLQKQHDIRMEAYVKQIARIQSKLILLETLGEKLVQLNHLNKKEFDFDKPIAIGGPNDEQSLLDRRLSEVAIALEKRSQQLDAIAAIFAENQYLKTVTPSGRPAASGWISSYFGRRKDPFSGKKSYHKGIDVAAKSNTDIIATASGVVTWAKKRSGYGQMIEISHGNGIVTRYGHCKKILVKEGDIVKQGQVIGKIGSTGRSTGPHVHYEVLVSGKKINPMPYVRKKRT